MIPYNQLVKLESVFSKEFDIQKTSKGGIVNLECIDIRDNTLTVLMCGCPLYSHDGGFITHKTRKGIDDSRVAVKWQHQLRAAKRLREFSQEFGYRLKFKYIFADKGVLVPDGYDLDQLDVILNHHEMLYRDSVSLFIGSKSDSVDFTTYREIERNNSSSIVSMCPDYIQYNQSSQETLGESRFNLKTPEKMKEIEETLKLFIDLGIANSDDFYHEGRVRRRIMEKITSLSKFSGTDAALGILKQYQILHHYNAEEYKGSLFPYFERVPYLLLNMNIFNKRSQQALASRIEILCN
ncbi:hypothetical protein L4C34_09665 [Vibrio profundum]|uniref:hypothetical protein n=1 Tax=Vibrio profundum TaxID=2910247 RepID=UPI003D138B9A